MSVRENVDLDESVVISWSTAESLEAGDVDDENRARNDGSHLGYPSDLTDAERGFGKQFTPRCKRSGRQRTVKLQGVVNRPM